MSQEHLIHHIFEFNEQIIGINDVELNPLSQEQIHWTYKALSEEVAEFMTAADQEDIVGMVDAMLDLTYFAIGTLKKLGLTREQAVGCFHAVHTANMTKKRGGKATRGNFEEDATKPAGFVSPEMAMAQLLFKEV